MYTPNVFGRSRTVRVHSEKIWVTDGPGQRPGALAWHAKITLFHFRQTQFWKVRALSMVRFGIVIHERGSVWNRKFLLIFG